MWWEAAAGALLGVVLLALFARSSAKTLALNGYIALVAMLAIYIGARLVTGTIAEVALEIGIATAVVVIAKLAMDRWLPAIGIFIFGHGLYDALVGPDTGVAEWYPPLCAGFDFLVGIGLLVILRRRTAGN